ncbi:DNA adenine methylase [Riemerella anatipestifer]|uniref:Site-specific DNA-methyltransferase (adenine-specific) n=1 Tax=Riemerella anatipestifer (strain ATCC 11845 / DSM 15868 / JCM 9532 / NCTC 11014) TaxID=693978 RepID=E4TDT4_RIEAD|nr:DNA adenine methylase [Riemerella anatipestifer]ADQ82943.1 DNA adenine methylase [Riemerella anatipestifer ATCC 11845 = DSM 15868]ADZ11555.1 Site-specific DNA methylase [Riemerella anatipestifer RA-GD]AFD56956.1 Site-specific DNA methylase [Riemerella anatipestifer ATCC 11845 = DSM 15868]AGC41098.1 Site-specific DNA methylase [Riemerella anatipestifer RA-CH-2]AKP70106.1 DNA adenine methylase [Riemerella anatipestifer]
MAVVSKQHLKKIKSPLNYIGGKTKILDQILPLFPRDIDTFIDLFAGGCNVGINVTANKVYFNDNLTYLIEMYKAFQKNELDKTISHIEGRINEFQLSLTNEEGYKCMRETYNKQKHPLDLFVLIAFSFNHQIRFNNNHEFNNPFGRDRSSFNPSMKHNLERFIISLKETEAYFTHFCFNNFDFSSLTSRDFVYCDPPYLITTGTYNDGKRGFKGWTEKEEKQLLGLLDNLDKRNVKFGLSNVLEHKGKSNNILKKWIENNPSYYVNYINTHYSNSNYQTRNKQASIEVLITNYQPQMQQKEKTLFDDF